jgi:hypothetical protein
MILTIVLLDCEREAPRNATLGRLVDDRATWRFEQGVELLIEIKVDQGFANEGSHRPKVSLGRPAPPSGWAVATGAVEAPGLANLGERNYIRHRMVLSAWR